MLSTVFYFIERFTNYHRSANVIDVSSRSFNGQYSNIFNYQSTRVSLPPFWSWIDVYDTNDSLQRHPLASYDSYKYDDTPSFEWTFLPHILHSFSLLHDFSHTTINNSSFWSGDFNRKSSFGLPLVVPAGRIGFKPFHVHSVVTVRQTTTRRNPRGVDHERSSANTGTCLTDVCDCFCPGSSSGHSCSPGGSSGWTERPVESRGDAWPYSASPRRPWLLIVNQEGVVIRSNLDNIQTIQYFYLLCQLAQKARSVVRDLNSEVQLPDMTRHNVSVSKNDMRFLHVRTK